MPSGNNRFASLTDLLEHGQFYVKKYGALGAAKVALSRLRARTVGESEWLYSIDLEKGDSDGGRDGEDGLQVTAFKTESELSEERLASLCQHKSRRSCARFLQSWFSRGATLWLSVQGQEVVGLQWTIAGGFDGFYSIPVQAREVIIVAVEVFSPYRGQGLYPRMLMHLLHRLEKDGYRRAYLKVAASNASMQRSMAKLPFQKLGRVYTRKTKGKLVTIWDRKALS